MADDGKLVEVNTDDAAGKAREQSAQTKKMFDCVKFSNPQDITDPYLPLESLKQDILEGTEDGKKVRMHCTAMSAGPRLFS